MDPTVQVALIGVATTLVTTIGVIFAALLGKRPNMGTVEVLTQRLALRDEQIAELKADLAEERELRRQCEEAHA